MAQMLGLLMILLAVSSSTLIFTLNKIVKAIKELNITLTIIAEKFKP